MTDNKDENSSPVVPVVMLEDGKRSATIPSKNGNISVVSDAAAKQVKICLEDGSLDKKCLVEITYDKEPSLGVIPGLKLGAYPIIDAENIGDNLREVVSRALSGERVELKDAKGIIDMTDHISYTAKRQKGEPLGK